MLLPGLAVAGPLVIGVVLAHAGNADEAFLLAVGLILGVLVLRSMRKSQKDGSRRKGKR